MKGMILCAGLGTRLYPLTESKPKALIEINNTTLLELQIRKFISIGIKEIIINVHHFASQIKNYLSERNNFNIDILISDESKELLDTGGALKKAFGYLTHNQSLLVQNVDIFTDVNYADLISFYKRNDLDILLTISNRSSNRAFLFDDENKLKGWLNKKTNQVKPEGLCLNNFYKYAFSGIQILSPRISQFFQEENKFSIIDFFICNLNNLNIEGYLHHPNYFFDVGSPENLKEAEIYFVNHT